MPLLECQHLAYLYPSKAAVQDISLSLEEGECLALIGPSGAGKTTLLRCLAGFLPLSRGAVLLRGRDIAGERPSARSMAMIFQEPALFPHVRIRDSIVYGLHRQGWDRSRIEAALHETSAMLGIEQLLDRYPPALSGGEAQRAGIARALIRRPEILLLDEPFSSLDARLHEELRQTLLEIRRNMKMSMIMVTHDQADAMLVGDRIAVMNQGKIVSSGTPEQLYEQPRDLFTASFLGTPAMNLVPAEVLDDSCLKLLQGSIALPVPAVPGRVIAGFRPEQVRPDPEGPFQAWAAVSRRAGSMYLTVLQQGTVSLNALTPEPIPVGGIRFSLPPDQIALFDPESGIRIGACAISD
jgi:ABC-type sugar transport system ATPase subunit